MRTTALLTLALAAAAKPRCANQHPECDNWAKQGECIGSNSDTVKNLCPHSCGICAKLHVFPPSDKDEL